MSQPALLSGATARSGSLALFVLFVLPALGLGQDPATPRNGGKRVAAGKCISPKGTLLERESPDKTWTVVDSLDAVHTNDLLLALPGVKATVTAANNAVRLTLWGNLPQLSQLPSLESAVVLHEPVGVDLELTLERGRILVANRKETGPAVVRIRFGEETWELTLAEPGAEAGVDLWAGYPRGIPFNKDPKFADVPTTEAYLIITNGRAALKIGPTQFAMSAPPGPALFHYESDARPEPGPQRLEKLPPVLTAVSLSGPESKPVRDVVQQVVTDVAAKGVNASLAELFKDPGASNEDLMRQTVVYGLGAVDGLAPLLEALGNGSDRVRDAAVLTLKHWVGRDPKQDMALYTYLIRSQKYPEAQAETIVQLLHSFGEVDLSRPETYDTLISYLRHPKVAVRELAAWHLFRVAPAGNKIAYNPAAPEAEREKAYQEWRKLVPEGKLPPRPEAK